jgi:hypothetical protein
VVPSGIEDHRGRIPSLPDDVPRVRPRRFRRPHGLWRIYAGAVANEKITIRARPRDHATRRDLSPKIAMVVGSIVRRRESGSGYRQLRRQGFFARHLGLRNREFLDTKDRLTGGAIQDEKVAGLRSDAYGRDGLDAASLRSSGLDLINLEGHLCIGLVAA